MKIPFYQLAEGDEFLADCNGFQMGYQKYSAEYATALWMIGNHLEPFDPNELVTIGEEEETK